MRNAKILLVDDDADHNRVLKALLENDRYTVVTAIDRAEGMERIKSDKPNLIILDVMMSSWHDGFEMSRELKKDPHFRHIPILILTAIEGRGGLSFEAAAGDPVWLPVDGYLEKPAEPEQLLTEVRTLLSKAS